MSDYIQLWVPDRDGCMEPSEDRGYVTLEDHLAAVQALVQALVQAAVQAAVRAAKIQECEECARACEYSQHEWGTPPKDGDGFAAMLRGD